MQKRRALQADVNERGLHTGQHAQHATFVDVAVQAPADRSLDVDFLKHTVFEQRRAYFAGRYVYQDFFF